MNNSKAYKNDKELVRLVTAGSVDDGKSSLIGRLLFDSQKVYIDQVKAIKKTSLKKGFKGIDLSLLLDGLSAEREQGITIDVAYRHFETEKRRFLIADVPGHEEYTRNMASGAADANMALILCDARKGILTQSKRHLFIAALFGIPHILVVINKMDLVAYDEKIFNKIKKDFNDFAIKLKLDDLQFIPTSAIRGDMVVKRGKKMDWYSGRTIYDYLENVVVKNDRNLVDFRLPVQLVLRTGDSRKYAGMIESGVIKKGDKIIVLPSGEKAIVKKIINGGIENKIAFSPECVILEINKNLDISRGDMLVREFNLPEIGKEIETTVCWFAKNNLKDKQSYLLKQTTKTSRVYIEKIHHRIDIKTLHRQKGGELGQNEIGRVLMSSNNKLMYDLYTVNRNTGNFILIDEISGQTAGAGIISHQPIQTNKIKAQKRIKRAAVVWLTGLSGAGKSTLAKRVYKIIKARGVAIEWLDGDEMRKIICRDLGYSKKDRDENIRRAAYLAKLLSRNGIIVIASFITPSRKQRAMVRKEVKNYIEIFVNAPLEVCRARDVKGLYYQSKIKKITFLTGIDQEYQKPLRPDLELMTDKININQGVKKIIDLLKEKKVF